MNTRVTFGGGEPTTTQRRQYLSRIVKVYPSLILRQYCRIRLLIIGPRFLNVIGQYLPERGNVLEIGCGFGLSGLYFSGFHPERIIHGYDLNEKRVETANAVAQALELANARFTVGDAARLNLEQKFDAAYAVDIIHHLPREAVPEFLEGIYQCLQPGGRFLIKDVDNTPAYKRWVSWITDRVMTGLDEPIYYWPVGELKAALRKAGFTVYTHPMPDILPYPHVLYICVK